MAHDIRPSGSELSEARSVIDVILDATDRALEEPPSATHVGVGWAAEPSTAEAFGGAFSMCHSPDRITVRFVATVEAWTDAVMAATARGLGRAWLHGRLPDQRLAFRWQVVLAEAAGIALADRIAPDVEAPWATQATLADRWTDLADSLGDGVGAGENLDDIPYPLASLGVHLAASTSLEDLPEMTRTDVQSVLATRFDDA